ncbi:hypothetical protein [Paenibacillus planticolens]|uniref:Uncharacterized protein n=1 Tax=Paenibacillus planticolens TaxID=2654976 RepID=A0ABX1ZTQ9_9BACL|nr:hypothetical protein [Paenibacillus planticolens]NOV02239.1 hypothetical protein [Paenibacillus planticolens]
MKFRAVSEQTKMNYMLWSIKKEIIKETAYLNALPYDPTPIMEIVKHHIDAWDPVKLLALGCPDDEYEGETRTLTIYLTKHLQDLEIHAFSKKIDQLFRSSFGDEYQDEDGSMQVAGEILQVLRTLVK